MQSINWKSALLSLRYPIALVALIISLALYYSTSFYLIGDFVYNSDSLYLPALYADLVHGNNLAQWNLPPSSYLFPDLVLYLATSAFTPKLHTSLGAFALTQYFIFVIGLLLLARQVLPHSVHPFIPGLIALAGMAFIFSIANLEFYSQMIFVSAHHFGVLLTMPFVLALTHRAMSASQPNRLLYLLGTLSFLTTLSDWLYLIQVAVPLGAGLAILCFLREPDVKRTMIVSCSILVPSLFGLGTSLLYMLNRPMLVAYLFGPHPNNLSLSQLGDGISFMPLFHALLLLIFLSLCATAFARVVVPFVRLKRSVGVMNGLLPLYFLLTCILNFIAVAASGLWIARDDLRYFLPAMLFSAFWGWPFIVPIIKFKPEFLEWAIPAILGLFSILAWFNLDWGGLTWEYHPTYIQCLDEKTSALGIRRGIANYWQARPISMLSQNGLQVAQVNRDLSPYPWINNSAEYAIEPEFVVIDTSFPEDSAFRLDENLITRRFGKPDAAYYCERTEILVYGSNENFRFLFRDSLKK